MSERKALVACLASPNAADAELAVQFLREAGIESRATAGLRELAGCLDEAAGCAIVVEEALLAEELPDLREALACLPAWSDLPLIVVSRDVAALSDFVARAFPSVGNVTLLERPLNPHTLVSAVQVALRASVRQREVGELIAQREQAVRLRDEFLAMLAHELRNPLAPMRNAVHLMRMQKLEDPLLRKSTEILERQVEHVVRMVDDLMDVARLERGKVSLQKHTVDLNAVVRSAVESCAQAAKAKAHEISVHCAELALPVNGDPVRLEQVACNLVHNAIKFSPGPSRIEVSTREEKGGAVLAVRDRGIGFKAGMQERLFDPFMQVNPTLERTAGGLGMGLTIVRRLVELHGGSVRAESEGAGKGSLFEVRLPTVARAVTVPPQEQHPALAAQRRRIVLVEDNADIRETVRMLATLWGHEISVASDGPSGLNLVLNTRPDIAIIDIGLPGMNGYDVARAIRSTVPHDELRLVAMTGYGQPSDVQLAIEAGFQHHLLKPINPATLQQVLGKPAG